MEKQAAAAALACLGNETRLGIFRHVMAAGPNGVAAGDVARAFSLPASTTSFHLSQLEGVGLLISWKVRTSVRYAVDLLATRGLMVFLVEDCCRGNPHICGGLGVFDPKTDPKEAGMADDKVFNVLFLCTGNSARSILGEAILNRYGQGRFRAFSAGSQPKGQVHPYTLDILKNQNYPTAELRSKSWAEFSGPDAPALDFVFTVCGGAANEVCPVWPGQPMTAHWGIADPAAVEGTEAVKRAAFAEAMKQLTTRISLLTNLPLGQLDRLTLQKRLDSIGATADQDAEAPA